MFERFTEKARWVIFFGRYEAIQLGSPFIDAEHLLLGLLREDRGMVLRANLNSESVRREVESRIAIREKGSTSVDLPVSTDGKRALAYAAEEAEALGHRFVDTGHLLLALSRVEGSVAAIVIRQQGVTYQTLREAVRDSAEPLSLGAVGPESARRRTIARSYVWNLHAAAPSLDAPVLRLRELVEATFKHLGHLDTYAEQRLKREPWSRKEALGHLVDWATTHHQFLARALTEPQLIAPGFATGDWVSAQQYRTFPWPALVDLWVSINKLLIHVIALIPQDKVKTVCRIGIGEPVDLETLIDGYIGHTEDLVGQILARL